MCIMLSCTKNAQTKSVLTLNVLNDKSTAHACTEPFSLSAAAAACVQTKTASDRQSWVASRRR